MRKNNTSFSVIKNPPINIVRNRSISNLNEYKIEKEIKSLPIELRKNLQKVLSKMELSSEVYIPKNLPLNRQFEDKNLLINKIRDYDNFILEKRKSNSRLSQDNSTFLKVYSHIKELESQNGKISRQQEFFDEIEKLYLSKDYNMDNCRIKDDENIFDYSLLIDKDFGNNIKQDAIRILNELDNTDIDLEQKFIFDLNSELYNQKLKNTFRSRYLKSKSKKPKDYGFENIKKSEEKKIINYIFGIKKKRKKNKKENKKDNKKEKPDYFNNKIKKEISEIKEVIESIKNNYQEKSPMSLMNFLKTNSNSSSYEKNKDRNKKDNLILINIEEGKDYKHYNTEKNFIKIPKLKIKNIFKENKDNSKNNNSKDKKDNNNIPKIFNKKKENINNKNENIVLDLKDENINLNQNNNNKRKDELPKINMNNSIDESKNINLNLTSESNFSRDTNEDNLKSNIFRLKQNNNKDLFSRNDEKDKINYNPDRNKYSVKKEKPIKIPSIKKLKKKKIITYKSIPNLKTFLSGDGDKKVLTDKEINLHLLKFKKRHNSILQNLKNSKIKETNLHGFTKKFQNVTKERNFSFVFEKNKFLKNNDFSNLLSHFDDNNDEIDSMNIKEIDKKIMNIHYDMAEFLLKNISH